MDDVRLLDPAGLRLVEGVVPALDPATDAHLHRVWTAATAQNPLLFDGPVAACVGLDEDADGPVVHWARTTFRRYAGRRDARIPLLGALAVGVVVRAPDGAVLVGRMAPHTVNGGTWQLPGGNAEQPPRGDALTVPALRRHAAVELTEEVGLEVPVDSLWPWTVVSRSNGDVGILYGTDPVDRDTTEAVFERHCRAERAAGREPEFDRIAWVGPDGLSAGETAVDYLAAVLAALV